MVDRQDIDALLVGALYGELTPAEEARLTAHLESHPADKNALEDLKTARQAVRDSRVLDVQHEPPQAISALLLQEAHRRAPKVAREEHREGWFARVARSFLAHPAMAAAAMLVLVVGVAGTLYMTKGDQFAGKEASAPASERAEAPATGAAPAGPTAQPPTEIDQAQQGQGSGVVVGLADGQAAPEVKGELEAGKDKADKNAEPAREDRKVMHAPEPPAHHTASPPKRAIEVTTPAKPMPKDLDAPRAKRAQTENYAGLDDDYKTAPQAASNGAIGGGAGPSGPSGTTGSVYRGGKQAAPATPSAAPMQPSAPAPAPPPPPPAMAKADSADSSLMAWAQAELKKTIELVKAGNCPEAAKHALDIHARAPDFYAQNVKDSRQLSSCSQYFRDRAEAADERQKRAKPAPNEMAK